MKHCGPAKIDFGWPEVKHDPWTGMRYSLSGLKAAGLDVTGAIAHVTNPTDKIDSMSLSRQDSHQQQYRVEELAKTQTTSSHYGYEHQDRKPQQSCINPHP